MIGKEQGSIMQIPRPKTAKRKWSTQLEMDVLLVPDEESATFESNPEKEEVEEIPPTSNIHKKKKAKTNGGPTSSYPGGGRKGLSAGLSTVVRRGERGAAE